jgi:hypothetical protein
MLEQLAGDRRSTEHRLWEPWFAAADRMARRFLKEWEDDPFAYNETASVGTLAAAAARAGYSALVDYVATKGRLDDRRHSRPGRCDMWLGTEGRAWAFEFKQRHAGSRGIRGLRRGLGDAIESARCVRKVHGKRVAGLIVSLAWLDDDAFVVAERKLAMLAGEVDFAWRFAASRGEPYRTYVFLSLID